MSEVLAIHLDEPDTVFFPGQTIGGTVHIWVRKDDVIKSITLKAKGKSSVSWVQYKSGDPNDAASYLQFSSKEKIFDIRFGLDIPQFPGPHKIPFKVALPEMLPSSFEGVYGAVRYKLKVEVEYAKCLRVGLTKVLPIFVSTVFDLGMKASLSVGRTEASKVKTLGCCCCSSDPIDIKAWIEPTGYLPGQTIHFKTIIENGSGKQLRGILKLVRIEQYQVEQPFSESKIYNEILHEEALYGDMETWNDTEILVPATVPSTMPHCKNIEISYQLQFTIITGVCSSNVNLNLDLYIGTKWSPNVRNPQILPIRAPVAITVAPAHGPVWSPLVAPARADYPEGPSVQYPVAPVHDPVWSPLVAPAKADYPEGPSVEYSVAPAHDPVWSPLLAPEKPDYPEGPSVEYPVAPAAPATYPVAPEAPPPSRPVAPEAPPPSRPVGEPSPNAPWLRDEAPRVSVARFAPSAPWLD